MGKFPAAWDALGSCDDTKISKLHRKSGFQDVNRAAVCRNPTNFGAGKIDDVAISHLVSLLRSSFALGCTYF